MLRYTIATGKTATDIAATYGVQVSGSNGLVGKPEFKNPSKKYDWDYLNGEFVDMECRRYKAREITLHCWLKGSSEIDAVGKMNTFLKAFQTKALMRLTVTFLDGTTQGNSSLYYLVYLANPGSVTYKWHSGKQILKFDIVLKEPSPVKRVYKVAATDNGTITIAYSSTSEFDIYWGDASKDLDNMGASQTISHSYTEAGNFVLIVTGVITDISAMTVTTSGSEITVTQIFDEI